jgi:hypothetical protein
LTIFVKPQISSQHGEFFQVFLVYFYFLYILFKRTLSAAPQILGVGIIFLLKADFLFLKYLIHADSPAAPQIPLWCLEDAEIEPRTVATLSLAVGRSTV